MTAPFAESRKRLRLHVYVLAVGAILADGCAHFDPEPISADKSAAELEARSLTNGALRVFLETNLDRQFPDWPPAHWEFDMLTLAAFYHHPDLALARAQWHVAQAGVKTAGGRPNPTLSLVPGYNTTRSPGLSPWFPAVSFDVPIETAGKRGKRIRAAEHLSEAARLNTASVAWQVRQNLRASLLDLVAARQRGVLLQEQVSVQEQIVQLLEQQAKAGAIARSDIAAFAINLQRSRIDLADNQGRQADARGRFATAMGVPFHVLDGMELSFDLSSDPLSPTDLASADIRRVALTSRLDILSALAEYAGAEAGLQLEIARQYPDVHISPGYQFDQGDNKWAIGITFELPILNQNQGPIAEAKARREEAAARFNSVQARVLGEIERAVDAYRVSETNSAAFRALNETEANRLASIEAQFKAGAIDQPELLSARAESIAAKLTQLDAQLKLHQAFNALETATQQPMNPPVAIFKSQKQS